MRSLLKLNEGEQHYNNHLLHVRRNATWKTERATSLRCPTDLTNRMLSSVL